VAHPGSKELRFASIAELSIANCWGGVGRFAGRSSGIRWTHDSYSPEIEHLRIACARFWTECFAFTGCAWMHDRAHTRFDWSGQLRPADPGWTSCHWSTASWGEPAAAAPGMKGEILDAFLAFGLEPFDDSRHSQRVRKRHGIVAAQRISQRRGKERQSVHLRHRFPEGNVVNSKGHRRRLMGDRNPSGGSEGAGR